MKKNSSERLQKIQELLRMQKEEYYLVSNLEDLFYLTGKVFSRGFAFISSKKAVFFIDARYREIAKQLLGWTIASIEEKGLRSFFAKARNSTITFAPQDLTVEQFQHLKKLSSSAKIKWKASKNYIFQQRMIKDSGEIKLIKKSAAITLQSIQESKKKVKEGMTEIELARIIQQKMLSLGAEKLSFEPIIAFGKNTSMPHYRSGLKKLRRNQLILIDIGCYYSRYASDMTRVHFFGDMPSEVKRLDIILKEAVQIAIDLCKPGQKIIQLDQAVRNHFKKYGVEKNFVHSLGHGIGLEVHELPRVNSSCRKQTLEEGMVITIEPGLYFPKKFGLRHEEMVLITPKGHQVITQE